MTHPVATRAALVRSRPRTAVLWFALALLFPVGCRSANQELIEAELRAKEEQLDLLKQEVDRRDLDARALELEIAQLQRACTKPGHPAGSAVVVKEITLGRLTGGVDEDPKLPGDEALQVIVEPRDADNSVVKVPGSLHVCAYEILPQGQKVFLSSWDVSPGELRRKWDEPLLGSSAYRVVLPWKTQPTTERLRVAVKFRTLDGQEYEAEKDVSIRLPDLPRRRHPIPPREMLPPPGEAPLWPHPCTSGEEELDAPRPLLVRPTEQKPPLEEPPPPEPALPPGGRPEPPTPPPPVLTPVSLPKLAPPQLQPPRGAKPAPPALPSDWR